MYEGDRSKAAKQRSGRTNLASCIVAGVFLVLMGVAVVVVYFLLFKPKQPQIAVNAVQFPSLSVSNKTLNFTFFQLVTVTNPNRDTFTHYDSSLQLGYSGSPVGFVFIPAGSIDGGRSQHMSAKFSVQEFPFWAEEEEDREAMEIETEMKLVGRVRVLKVFTHRVETQVKCRVGVHLNDASVLGFHC